MKTKEVLPKGWKSDEFSERRDAIKLLPKRVRVLLTCEWARSVIRVYDKKYPRDDRPLKAIEAAESWINIPNAANAANAANATAYAAADAAAYDAAYAAADAAADAAANAAANAANAAADAAANAANAAADAAADATANAAYAAADAATYAAYAAADAAAYAAVYAAANAAYAAYAVNNKKKWIWLYKTYKYCKGPENVTFDDTWRTSTCIALARNIYDTRDFTSMPILADALQDAGCDCEETLAHLRHDSEHWTRANCALWNLLGLGNDL